MQPKLVLDSTIYTLDQLIAYTAPQIALAGRSNVGKSSLVNTLAGRKGLARISSTPGKTRSINFYQVDPDAYYVVDLPGYGYARCSKVEREKWAKLIRKYLTDTPAVCGIAILLDCRLTPQKLDVELASFARQAGIPLLPVLTKADKCKQQERAKRQREWRDILGGGNPILFSSKTGMGKDKLWNALHRMAFPDFVHDIEPESDSEE
ncbi:ribosome biogenesis GTP-binding protein YihA/YsxC [Oleidesulfovibrio sp.]|uniref:ribosome biogenesis GTP-binding protein YihA/YsxC n=1 Tax=Oleidesulfovibrio sp. TaxID=2909707 RepID=UPI003A8B95D1